MVDLVIVTAHFSEDLNWLKAAPYPVVVCTKEGAATPAIPADPRCTMPNVGREATSYLKYIIEYYDELPEYVAFIHGHETAWHQTVDILQAINGAKYNEYGFIGLNGIFFVRNINTEFHSMMVDLWNTYFKHDTGIEYPMHRAAHSDACAQFIVSRENIKRNSKERYVEWLNLILNHTLPELPSWKGTHLEGGMTDNSWKWGIVFELLWHLIFRQPPTLTEYESSNYMKLRFTCFPEAIRGFQDYPLP